jgi:hypothetical protein
LRIAERFQQTFQKGSMARINRGDNFLSSFGQCDYPDSFIPIAFLTSVAFALSAPTDRNGVSNV